MYRSRHLLRACKQLKPMATLSTYHAIRSTNALRYAAGGVAASGLALWYGLHNQTQAATGSRRPIDTSQFMSDPVTDLDKLEANRDDIRTRMELMIMKTQADVCRALERADGETKFLVEPFKRENGGGGVTCVMQDGFVFEKAGVNVSVFTGEMSPAMTQQMKARLKNFTVEADRKIDFFVAGISSVIHPKNPNVPTMHFNYRYFAVTDAAGKEHWWFGGGIDLTPMKDLVPEDVVHFHSTQKAACDKHDLDYYPKFKKWCDEYFYIKHRGECRGVGGIFFDDLDNKDREQLFDFVSSCAGAVVPAYLPIVERQKDRGYGYADRQWQLLRRGRYVEFNLVYDRGTKFGFQTPGARYESILMSLPLYAKWEYKHSPPPGSKQDELLTVLKNPKDWV